MISNIFLIILTLFLIIYYKKQRKGKRLIKDREIKKGEIENNKQCFCGNKVLTFDNEKIMRKKLCCGPDTCFINETGDGICPD